MVHLAILGLVVILYQAPWPTADPASSRALRVGLGAGWITPYVCGWKIGREVEKDTSGIETCVGLPLLAGSVADSFHVAGQMPTPRISTWLPLLRRGDTPIPSC